jgi:thiol peroxidase
MAAITLKGNPIHSSGKLPPLGTKAPEFRLTRADLSDASLADFAGRVKILNIVPSLDTSTCALSAKRFNQEVKKLGNAVVLTVSRDLPFAPKRVCAAAGSHAGETLTELRDRSFGAAYGVELVDGPLAGLLARAVLVLDGADRVVYSEQVPEIGQEPDYAAALEAAQKTL